MAGKKQNMALMWKKLMKLVILGEDNIICWWIRDVISEMFESRVFCWSNKNYWVGKTSRENCSVVLRHGRTSSKMRRATLWIVKQMHSVWMQTKWNNNWTICDDVWITFSACATSKLPGCEASHAKNCRVVLRDGRSLEKVRGKMLWLGKQKDRAVVQSLISLLGRP